MPPATCPLAPATCHPSRVTRPPAPGTRHLPSVTVASPPQLGHHLVRWRSYNRRDLELSLTALFPGSTYPRARHLPVTTRLPRDFRSDRVPRVACHAPVCAVHLSRHLPPGTPNQVVAPFSPMTTHTWLWIPLRRSDNISSSCARQQHHAFVAPSFVKGRPRRASQELVPPSACSATSAVNHPCRSCNSWLGPLPRKLLSSYSAHHAWRGREAWELRQLPPAASPPQAAQAAGSAPEAGAAGQAGAGGPRNGDGAVAAPGLWVARLTVLPFGRQEPIVVESGESG